MWNYKWITPTYKSENRAQLPFSKWRPKPGLPNLVSTGKIEWVWEITLS